MSQLVVEVCRIQEIKPHPNADALELGQVKGWQVVLPKDQHSVDDLIVYCPPDTVLPRTLTDRLGVTKYLSRVAAEQADTSGTEASDQVAEERYRIRSTRLRGQPSFGLAFAPDEDWPEGEDVAEYYGATKYAPPVRPYGGGISDAVPEHYLFAKYTEIENLRNFPDIFVPGEEVVVTEKIHGANVRVAMIEDELMAGSRRLQRKRPADEELKSNQFWFPITVPGVGDLLESWGARHRQVVLYGEVFGRGVQSLHYGQGGLAFRAFDLLMDGHYLDADAFSEACAHYDVPTVPILYRGEFSIERMAQLSGGATAIVDDREHIREGVVVRPAHERSIPELGRLIAKYVSDEYLLKDKSDYTEQ